MIKDAILFSNEYKYLSTACPSCNKFDHRMAACPYLNYLSIANRDFLIHKLIYSKPQTRNFFARKSQQIRLHALFDRKKIMKKVINIRFNKDVMGNYLELMASKNNLENEDSSGLFSSKNLNSRNNLRKYSYDDKSEGFKKVLKKYKSLEEIPHIEDSKKLQLSFDSPLIPHLETSKSLKTPQKSLVEQQKTQHDLIEKNSQSILELDHEKNKGLVINTWLCEGRNSWKTLRNNLQEKRQSKKLFIDTKKKNWFFSMSSSNEEVEKESEKNKRLVTMRSKTKEQSKYSKRNNSMANSPKLKDRVTKDLFCFEFERMKEYTKYSKENNASCVVRESEKRRFNTKIKKFRNII